MGEKLNSNATAVRGVAWTTGTFALSIVIRFGSNVILSRLLTPELFGIVLIVNTIRQGVELSTDVGFSQNIVQNRAGGSPIFFNTVWVLQMVRALILGTLLFLSAATIGEWYAVPATAIQISAAILVASGLPSTSLMLLHRNMQLGKLTLFELAQEGIGAIVIIAAALVSPTVNSLMIAVLGVQLIRSLSTYFLTDDRNRLQFSKQCALEVVTFGRWIFLSSVLTFLCANFDRLYLGKVAPLAVVGVYGIARALADMPTFLAARIGYTVIFPFVSSAQNAARSDLRSQLSSLRFKLLLVAAVGVAFGISICDMAITLIYDARYHDAAWMLPLLLLGGWLVVLCSINEYTMLGLGKPSYNVVGNGIRLAYYVTVLPVAFQKMGIIGAIVAIMFSDIGRYIAIGIGQRREQFSFLKQDAAATLIFIGLVIAMSWGRSLTGFGTAFDSVPLEQIGWMLGKGA